MASALQEDSYACPQSLRIELTYNVVAHDWICNPHGVPDNLARPISYHYILYTFPLQYLQGKKL